MSNFSKKITYAYPSVLSLAVASILLLSGCDDINKATGTALIDTHDTDQSEQTDKKQDTVKDPIKKPVEKSPLVKDVDVKTFTAQQLAKFSSNIQTANKPKCDVEVKKVTYNTVGSAGEPTTATTALMIPKGGDDCNSDRPILLYAHGTSIEKSYDMTQLDSANNDATGQAIALAKNFAGQGYIVVAPNYAGYDESPLDYHPYLNKKQQTADMYHALQASKAVLGKDKKTSASDKLFITGYSQGGYVALATSQYLQTQGVNITAVAPLSGSYSMLAFGDEMFGGKVNMGATIFAPLIAINYQKQYGNLYTNLGDIITKKYAQNLTQANVLPGKIDFSSFLQTQVPYSEMFQSNTGNAELDKISPPSIWYAHGFSDNDYLIKTDYRLAYLADVKNNPDGLFANNGKPTSYMPADNPQNPFRQALKDNDLRDYVPNNVPILICGGNQDPMVFFDVNATAMGDIWQKLAKTNGNLDVIILDVDTTNASERTGKQTLRYIGNAKNRQTVMTPIMNNIQKEFTQSFNSIKDQVIKNATDQGMSAFEAQKQGYISALTPYHSGLASKSCGQATYEYFSQFD